MYGSFQPTGMSLIPKGPSSFHFLCDCLYKQLCYLCFQLHSRTGKQERNTKVKHLQKKLERRMRAMPAN